MSVKEEIFRCQRGSHELRTAASTKPIQPMNEDLSRILLFGSFVCFVMTVRAAERPGIKELKPDPD